MSLGSRANGKHQDPEVNNQAAEEAVPESSLAQDVQNAQGAVSAPAPNIVNMGTAGVPTRRNKTVLALEELAYALPVIPFGTLPLIKLSQGSFIIEGDDLGDQITFTIKSYNNTFVISPNDNKADTSFCKYSDDNQYLNDGSNRTVKEYIEYLHDAGFPDAGSKRYLEVVGILDAAEIDNEEIGNIVVLTLSPQSVKKFEGYQLQTTVKIQLGQVAVEDAARVVITARKKQYEAKKNFTLGVFKTAPPLKPNRKAKSTDM